MRAHVGLLGVAAGTLALAGCNPAKLGEHRDERSLVASARLDCPEHQRGLTRTSMAPDGGSCGYTGEAGETVTLQLASLAGQTPKAALDALEAELKQTAPKSLVQSGDKEGVAGAKASASANASWGVDDEGSGSSDEAHIDLPGFHVDAHGDGAVVNLPGVHINADNGKAVVNIDKPGGRLVSIKHENDRTEVRTGDITRKNVDATYLLAVGDENGGENSAVGYVARGPVGGPLVIGRFTGRGVEDRGDDLVKDVRRLVSRNVRRS